MFKTLEFFPALAYARPLLQKDRRRLFRFVATTLGRSLFSILSIVVIQRLFSSLLKEETGGHTWSDQLTGSIGRAGSLALALGALLTIEAAAIWCRYDNQMVFHRLIRAFELHLMERIIRSLFRFSAQYFQRLTPGDLIQALRHDVMQLRLSIAGFGEIVFSLVSAISLITTAVWLSPQLSFWSFCIMPLGTMPIVYFAKRIQHQSFAVRHMSSTFYSFILELITGIRIIKAYQAEERETSITVDTAAKHFKQLIEQTRLTVLGNCLMEMLTSVSVIIVLVAGSVQIMRGTLQWSELVAFLVALRGSIVPLKTTYNAFLEIQRATASVSRLTEMLEAPPDLTDIPGAITLEASPRKISFEHVTFGYGEQPVVTDATFEVAAGEAVAIVGPSGAGKSTLLNLIPRFFDPSSGQVRYDGRDIRDVRMSDLYHAVAIVAQEPFLFSTSVRENIRVGRPDATDAEVEAAAVAASVHEDILELAEGYETMLGIGGRALSRGQSQRINLARAFLKNAPILLLDEATSSLDALSEQQVQNAINRLMQGRTSFYVTHRLSSVEHADRIILCDGMSSPRIGTHDELYHSSAIYRQMCEIQQFSGPSQKH